MLILHSYLKHFGTPHAFQKEVIENIMKKLFDSSAFASLFFMSAISFFLALAVDYYLVSLLTP